LKNKKSCNYQVSHLQEKFQGNWLHAPIVTTDDNSDTPIVTPNRRFLVFFHSTMFDLEF